VWDDQYDGNVPLYVVNGKEISLVELGRVLMSLRLKMQPNSNGK